eukprot:TRINITY_DN1870_c1_g1_i1.p1 TRINITY_DN1870_c1_g1~~TRINITY_DN1870_c1_g1_i1.p1  ORF type:complete len:292 (+),score=58.87 TRINITY_DN1870_c1_g1_i1:94-969(+)
MSRPELLAPPEFFYDEKEAEKYSSNTRMIEIQSRMSERALELLALPADEPSLLLDIGCGSGLSGTVLSNSGHEWIGFDISSAMLNVAVDRKVDGDMFLLDMGQGVPFRPGVFDGAISVSALQWLCNKDKSSHNPVLRMRAFFQSLYNSLKRGARAVFQFYPSDPQQMQMLTNAAMRSGFSGGIVIDYPNSTKAKKIFLCLWAGTPPGGFQLPQGLNGTEEEEEGPRTSVTYDRIEARNRAKIAHAPDRKRGSKKMKKSKEWIQAKKDSQRKQGKDVRPDSKYTGRKRRGAF